jgi:hypothetical protein
MKGFNVAFPYESSHQKTAASNSMLGFRAMGISSVGVHSYIPSETSLR